MTREVDGVHIETEHQMVTPRKTTLKRSTYRHGDLHNALVQAGIELARGGGPDAVVLREATRQVGVAPNAAYRHFADRRALLLAVCAVAQAKLAEAMEAELAKVPSEGSRSDIAQATLRAVGTAYLAFAKKEPGLFRTAFSVHEDLQRATTPDMAGPGGLTPFQILGAALDKLVDAGVLPPERRPGAEFLAWSAVHGLAMLLLDGPLRSIDTDLTQAISERVLRMVENGL
ncbi:TetR/AcrR family transcriptional regulator [Pendulispora brunnea]|uniref:TetR/AcrR family transcriptional regulator n=1 Tax=Pendulispora brunnea TaxID=2905690 RepID=A0ABZ2K001_9BACT